MVRAEPLELATQEAAKDGGNVTSQPLELSATNVESQWLGASTENTGSYAPGTTTMGGKGPQIVFDDADIDAALPFIVNAIVQNSGQTCSAGSRLLVQRALYEPLLERLGQRFTALRAGPQAEQPHATCPDPGLPCHAMRSGQMPRLKLPLRGNQPCLHQAADRSPRQLG